LHSKKTADLENMCRKLDATALSIQQTIREGIIIAIITDLIKEPLSSVILASIKYKLGLHLLHVALNGLRFFFS
jgi:hypothetical protein